MVKSRAHKSELYCATFKNGHTIELRATSSADAKLVAFKRHQSWGVPTSAVLKSTGKPKIKRGTGARRR